MAKFARRSFYVSPETSYNQSPRPADSTYRAVPAAGTLSAQGGVTTLDSGRFTGRTGQAPSSAGRTEAEGEFALELWGYPTQAGAGDAVPAADVLDLLLRGVAAGAPIERAGIAVAGITGTPAVELDLGAAAPGPTLYAADDVIALADATGNVRWRRIVSNDGGGDYTIDSPVDITPTVAYGVRIHADDDGADTSITYAGALLLDTFWREIPGIKLSSMSVEWTPNGFATASFGMRGADFREFGTDPSVTVATNGDPAVIPAPAQITGCLYVDGANLGTATLSLDMGIEVQDREDTCAPSGRSNVLQLTVNPTITVTTPFADTYDALNRSKDLVDVRIVAGEVGGSVCFSFPNCQVVETAPADSSGILDSAVTLRAATVGTRRRWLVARC